jgi:hypothetical protein
VFGSGGLTRIHSIPNCVVVAVDAGVGHGIKNVYSRECKSEYETIPSVGASKSGHTGIRTVSDGNGI